MLITELFFAVGVLCTGPTPAPECQDRIIGPFTDKVSCQETVAVIADMLNQVRSPTPWFLGADCVAVPIEGKDV